MPTLARRKLFPVSHGALYVPAPSGGAWSPLTVSSAFWYDATDAATFTLSGSNVTQWRDKSGNSRHLTKQSGALDAVRTASVKNGLPGVLFNVSGSTGSVLETTSSFTLAQPFTLVLAIQTGSATILNFATLIMNTAGDMAILVAFNTLANKPTIYAGTGIAMAGSVLSTVTNYTLYGQFNNTTSVGGVNGVAGTPGTAGTTGFSSTNLQLGRVGSDLPFEGYVLEAFGFSGVSGTDLTSALGYLTTKWGAFP